MHDIVSEGGRDGLVMDYVDGETLEAPLRRRSFSLRLPEENEGNWRRHLPPPIRRQDLDGHGPIETRITGFIHFRAAPAIESRSASLDAGE
jgi:hypothetical protein